MRRFGKFVASAIVSVSLIASSTVADASTRAPAPVQTNAWMTLSMLAPSGTTFAATTAAAAAQPAAPTCPDGTTVPETGTCAALPASYAGPTTPPIPVLLIWAAVLGTMVYLATKNHHLHPKANSPA